MPKLFEYLGILIFFYSNEHEPIHVHAKKGEFESKADIFMQDGEIKEVKISNVKSRTPLTGKDLKNLKAFLAVYAEELVKRWIDYFVYHKEVPFEKVTKKL